MRNHGKGVGITINHKNPSTSHLNHLKMVVSSAMAGVKIPEWHPLKVKAHPRQAEIDAFMALPSRFVK